MFQRELTVLPSGASCHGRLKLRNLLDYFQDTASVAVAGLYGTTAQLMSRGYAWVLMRYELEIMAPLPALDEPFIVGTFHDPQHGYACLRVFQVSRPDGTLLAWAKTSWLLLDLAAGRPVRPVVHLPEITRRDNQPIDPSFRDIPALPDDFHTISCPVRFHDLDPNGHVNNAVYFEWAFEAAPLDLMRHEVKSISATFRSGVRWGEDLKIRVGGLPPSGGAQPFVCHFISGSRPGSEKPMTTFYCIWEEKS